MLAPRTAVPSTARQPAQEESSAERALVRPATEEDPAAPSPVHALHAELSKALDRSPRARIDLVKVAGVTLMILYTIGAWWGLFSLGSFLARVFAH